MSRNSRLLLSFVAFQFLLSRCFCLVPPNCTIREDDPCDGIKSSGGTLSDLIDSLYNHLCGCVYINGDIEIVLNNDGLLVESDFSFLYHIREIRGYLYMQDVPEIETLSFPNLTIIRGETLYEDLFALATFNVDIDTLYMPQLTEITNSDVLFRSNDGYPSVCNVLNVNWDDILSGGSVTTILPTCNDNNTPNCSSIGCDNCWCNTTAEDCCQSLTSNCGSFCNGGRCNVVTINDQSNVVCCDSECAAGCTGGTADDCRACVAGSVRNGDSCSENCPVMQVFDMLQNQFVPNPDFKFEHEGLCVIPCPSGTFELREICVEQCSAGFMSVPSETGGEKCEKCASVCPKECSGGTSDQIDTNCTIILGSLNILNNDNPLDKLSTIREITGSLSIELFPKTSFPYLSNLEIIGSDFSEVGIFPCLSKEPDRPYSIYITRTDLVSIDLSSLRDISGGGVSLDRNCDLCFVGDFSQFITNTSADLCLSNQYRLPIDNCTDDGLTCHSQCNSSHGCWGQADTQCVSCINFEYNGRCVQSCTDFEDLGEYLYDDTISKQCMPCDELCNGSCTGEGPSRCSSCLSNLFISLGNGLVECIDGVCPLDTYQDTISTGNKMECFNCSRNCTREGGCNGPLSIRDDNGGCLQCDSVLMNSTGHQISCSNGFCPIGYYQNDSYQLPNVSRVCSPCHDLCSSCRGSGVENCINCKFAVYNTQCVFQCGSETIESLDNSGNTVCVEQSSNVAVIASSISAVIVIIIVVAILVIFGAVCTVRLRRQQSKIIDSRYSGFDREELELRTLEKETLQPPMIAPNAARLVVTPEDALEFGKELGAGAFGTVYEGYWKPDNDDNQYHVAIKVLKNTSPMANKELLQEGVLMGSMDHENVVRLYCVCMSKQLMLVSQYVPLGAMLDYLKRHKDNMSSIGILQFASQIALGMGYLETKRLVHRDLAARNVLVQSHRKVKITDFGLTRIIEADQEHYEAKSAKMPVRWLPPESIRHRVFTHKSDVWSFGITVWEILTFGARPYQGKKPFEILKQIEAGRRLEQPMTCTIELYGILLECWLPEPESRPSFDDLHARLKEMLKDPSRYVLTVSDGNASDYGQLPSNEKREGETVYETPFARDVSLDGTLPSNVSSTDPYSNQNGYFLSGGSAEKGGESIEKKPGSYEMPMPSPKSLEDPRYVKVNLGQSHPFPVQEPPHTGYDYIDEKRLQQATMQNTGTDLMTFDAPNSPYEVPEDGKINSQYKSQPNNKEIEDHYDMNQSYEQPMNSRMYKANTGNNLQAPTPHNDDYEVPEDPETIKRELEKSDRAFGNPVYDTNTSSVPTTHNYEMMDDDSEPVANGINNLVYDSTAGIMTQAQNSNTAGIVNDTYDVTPSTVPPIGDYETIDEDNMGMMNDTYDSTAVPKGNLKATRTVNDTYDVTPSTVPPIGDYETIDEDNMGMMNDTYDSTAVPKGNLKATRTVNDTYDVTPSTVPPIGDYETIDEDNMGMMNDTYDSTAVPKGNLKATRIVNDTYDLTPGTVPPTSNYETIDDDNMGIINDTYDVTPGTVPVVPPIGDYETIDEPDETGIANDTYDSTAGLSLPSLSGSNFANLTYDSRANVTNSKVPFEGMNNATYDSRVPVNNQQPSANGLVNTMYDSRAGVLANNNVPLISNYEVINDVGNGVVPATDNYEMIQDIDIPPTDNYEVVDSNDVAINNSFVNRMYDSGVGVKIAQSKEDRVASPYEVPVIINDYELPNDGNPDINNDYELPNDGNPDVNIYDAPLS